MKSENVKMDISNEQAVKAVKNTITLAKLQKRRLRMKIISVVMIYIALKAVYGIFIDTAIPSNYNNLPMAVVYILLTIYIVITGIVSFKAFKKNYVSPEV